MEMEKDSRNFRNRDGVKREKWFRNIKLQENGYLEVDDIIANPSNYRKNRSRTESPPSKCYRTNKGINKGHPPGCSYCRPEIYKRMFNTACINRELRHSL